MSRFAGKVALVTGASSGVGRAVALGLAAEGAAVGAVGRDVDGLRATMDLISEAGGRADAIRADIRSSGDARRAVDEVVAAFGGLDLLANVAGVLRLGPVPDCSEEDWNLLFDTNVKGCFLLSKFAIPAMRDRGGGGGAIVNVSSVFAYAGDRGAGPYAASKAAVIALTKMMALDHVGEGIRVNCVAPGSMATPMLVAVAEQRSPENPQAVLDAAGGLHPIGRLVEPEEVARLVLFLLSNEADAIVGSCYTIDGGRLAKLGSA
jgi:NAD(P)-dependent dehydrogenase (short-subunit alcohol dehydrogenase family)